MALLPHQPYCRYRETPSLHPQSLERGEHVATLVLDVVMGEDADRKAERNSTRAFAALKRMAVNIVRQKQPKRKASFRARIKMAGWDEAYLTSLLM